VPQPEAQTRGEAMRIELNVSPQKLAEIEELMRECGIEKKPALINNALTLLKWAVGAVKNGRTIASVDEKNGKFRELEMPVLSQAASLASRKKESAAE
jgi:hypothetical protein